MVFELLSIKVGEKLLVLIIEGERWSLVVLDMGIVSVVEELVKLLEFVEKLGVLFLGEL